MHAVTEHGREGTRRDGRRRAGFTLVEMLVVIVIILILMGVVFKMTHPAAGKQAEAETVAKLERVKAAVEEFYAEYGQYPPVPTYDAVQPFRYEYPSQSGMRSDLVGVFDDQTWGTAPLFTFGLMSFLVPRYKDRASGAWASLLDLDQWGDYNDDQGDLARDTRACARWAPFLDGILYKDSTQRIVNKNQSRAYTNLYVTVLDGWYHEFVYVSPPPHQSYLIFSRGPDNAYDAGDPGNRASRANKDNIYGDVGFVRQ